MTGKQLICIVGIDGSGKTTLAKRLVEHLHALGIDSRYVWAGFNPTLIARFIFWLARRLGYRKNRHATLDQKKGWILKNRTWSVAYNYIVLADYILQTLIRVWRPLFFGQTVVCDRYIYDLIITESLVLEYADEKLLRSLERMQRLVPSPNLVFVADLHEEIAFGRKDDIPSIVFLKERRRRYQLVAEAHDLSVLDAKEPLETLLKNVVAEVPLLPGAIRRAN